MSTGLYSITRNNERFERGFMTDIYNLPAAMLIVDYLNKADPRNTYRVAEEVLFESTTSETVKNVVILKDGGLIFPSNHDANMDAVTAETIIDLLRLADRDSAYEVKELYSLNDD